MNAPLCGDSWRHRHDTGKLCLMNMALHAKLPVDAEVFGLFRDLIPAEAMREGEELDTARARSGIIPDLRLRVATAAGPVDSLAEIKYMSAGPTRYPRGSTEKAADRRARGLAATYKRPLAKLDQKYHGTGPGESGPLVSRLQSYPLLGLVIGMWSDCSADIHELIQTLGEARAAHESRTTGEQVSEGQMSQIISQYRRLFSTTCVRAQALCLLARMGQLSPGAKDAAQRREIAVRLEENMRRERQGDWMANIRGMGISRRGRFMF